MKRSRRSNGITITPEHSGVFRIEKPYLSDRATLLRSASRERKVLNGYIRHYVDLCVGGRHLFCHFWALTKWHRPFGKAVAPLILVYLLSPLLFAEDNNAAALPEGVKAVWDTGKAWRETTATTERICLNGLWRWQPADKSSETLPASGWGYFKVPGCWPGISDYLQKDSQTVFKNPAWNNTDLGAISSAWYQREFKVPAEWTGRKIFFQAEYLNSLAMLFVDGQKAGEIRYPGGQTDLTAFCHPGATHLLSIRVTALPLNGVMLSYKDTATAIKTAGSVPRRGLCGDVYLLSTPSGAHVDSVSVTTSVRKEELVLNVRVSDLIADESYSLHVKVTDGVKSELDFTSAAFTANDLKAGRINVIQKWKPAAGKLWDIHTPENMFVASVSLLNSKGAELDSALPVRFGYREFWIDGRDFYLNGSRIFLSCVPVDNAAIGASTAGYESTKESLLRLKSFGINFVYTHNYGCEPGSHLSFAELLRAADDTGMLVAFSQPHFSHYDWKAPDADEKNGYARHAEFYVRAAQNHPSVVFYSMNHNATGYNEDMNPELTDGIADPRDNWSRNNVKIAIRAEAIVKALDPSRIVYHHASGNLGSMHNSNFYTNFVPIQELSDWFEHWSTKGVKPCVTIEYGAPFTWDWTMYRGWYKGKREFGSAKVPWEFCFAEWNAQFLGDPAFNISEFEKDNVRYETRQFREGHTWHRWDYPHEVGSNIFDDRHTVLSRYTTDNWRAFRTWGLSGNSPWEFGHFWKLNKATDTKRVNCKVDWENLQRPGFSPDYIDRPYERIDVAYKREDWTPCSSAQSLIRNNQPLLAYIAGKAPHFTSKDHNFIPGETVQKQIVVINNSRVPVTCECEWTLELQSAVETPAIHVSAAVATGEQVRLPISAVLPKNLRSGPYKLKLAAKFSNGEIQNDSLAIDVLSPANSNTQQCKFALFDPKGETAALLKSLAVPFTPVDAQTDLAPFDALIIGKAALSTDGPAPDVSRVRTGLKVIVFEQTSAALEQRLGFRVAEYGLRQVFPRIAEHPLLANIALDNLNNWRGEATLIPPLLKYELNPRFNGAATVKWCGMDVTRLWRCGCRGNVASVLIEKPACGDFLPIIDGGFSLQYSPLLEYHEGKGMILFCQMDVTGRSEDDPAARQLATNIVGYTAAWKPLAHFKAVYVGDPAGKSHLDKAGIAAADFDGNLTDSQLLIVGPDCAKKLAPHVDAIRTWLTHGGRLLAVGLDESEANSFLPENVSTKKAEHINTTFPLQPNGSWFAGVGPADVYNRDPREFALIFGGAQPLGDGIAATAAYSANKKEPHAVFCQVAPWKFDFTKQYNIKRTFRRVSFLLARLASNLGAESTTPMLQRLTTPPAQAEHRYLDGLYADTPEEMDDPYRAFRW